VSLDKDRQLNIVSAYDLYADMLYRVSLSYLGDKEEAQDAVQDVFAVYMTKSPQFKDEEHRKFWLIRVAVNRCHDLARRRSLRRYTALEDAADISVASPENSEVSELLEALAKVPIKNRMAIILHHLEGFSVEQTAEMLEISVSGAKMRLSRGREYLKNLLTESER